MANADQLGGLGRGAMLALMRRLCLAGVLALAALPAWALTASAEPNLVAEFPVPSNPGVLGDITPGPDGNLWFTSPKAIGRITPQGQITEFPVDSPGSPSAIIAGPDGNLWFTEKRPGAIGRITTSGQVTHFPLDEVSEPGGIARGPDDNLWFTADSSVRRITPAGQITKFALASDAVAQAIAAGPDGNLWFTGVRIPGPEGRIGRITPDGQVTDLPLAPKTYGRSIFIGPNGKLWLTFERGNWNKYASFNTEASGFGVIAPSGQIIDQLPAVGSPRDATAGPDGNLWFTGGSISRLTPQGQITEFPFNSSGSTSAIVTGPDGNLWFTGTRIEGFNVSSVIGRIPPGLLLADLRGEWWRMSLRGRWTAVSMACVGGGPGSACNGTLRLTTKTGLGKPGSPKRTITLAQRGYHLRAEAEHEFALRVSKRTLRLRTGTTNLRNVQVTATVKGGQDISRPLNVLERSPRQLRSK